MNLAFFEGESKFRVDVILVLFQVFPDGDRLFNKMIKILWEFWGTALFLENPVDFPARNKSDLRNPVLVSQNYADLALSHSLFGILNDQVDDRLRLQGFVAWGFPRVRQSRCADSSSHHSSHGL